MKCLYLVILFISLSALAKPRARDLGIPFSGEPGPLNAITDVAGVEVGQMSLIEGPSQKGTINGVKRTGVTVVFPKGKKNIKGVPVGWYTQNGNGELTGSHLMREWGLLEGPLTTTNTESLGTVYESIVKWFIKHFPIAEESFIPVVGETDDSWLNDMYGFHIRPEHVFQAIENAKSGPVEEGNVGGGTSNVTFHFKGGMGTSSRKVAGGYMLGVLVQSNFGRRQDFRIAGIPIGKKITDLEIIENPFPKMYPAPKKKAEKSIVVTLATDAPMLPHQLRRIAERVGLGMSRVGSIGRDSSGEFFVAFSTVQPKNNKKNTQTWEGVTLDKMDDFFEAAVDATEEAILNALVAAETMEGVNGNKVFAVPWDRVLPLLKQHNLLQSPKS